MALRISAIVVALAGRAAAAGEFLGSTAPANTAAPSEAAPANLVPNELADETTGFDSLGPFTEEPSPEQEANPAPAKTGWDNETGLQAAGTLVAGLSVSLTKWVLSVTRLQRSDAAGRPGASSSVAARCARVSVVGSRVVLG